MPSKIISHIIKENNISFGFSGRIGSGKSSISKYIAKKNNMKYISFGNFIRQVAKKRGLREERETLQLIGNEMIQKGIYKFCMMVLDYYDWKPNENVIIDGIRHIEIFNELKSIFSPNTILLVYISTDKNILLKRNIDRGIIDNTHLQEIENDETELDVKFKLQQISDYTINGSLKIKNAYKEFKLLVESLSI